MKKIKNNLDERQEEQLLHIERNGSVSYTHLTLPTILLV